MEMKDLLGGKGANLAEMTSVLRLPVPGGFTISTDACRAYLAGGWPKELDGEIAAQVAKLEKQMGRHLGDPADPLLVSVRSGAKFSMPGMMDTVLNLGLNDKSVKGLAASTGDERFAYDSYRRFISMYGRIVLGIDGALFEHPFEDAKRTAGVTQRCRARRRGAEGAVHDLQAGRQGGDGQGRSRRTRSSSSAARSRPCSRAGTAPGRSPTASASGSATTSAPPSTCRRWCSATATTTPAPASASPATPRPARTSPTATSSINAQGEDVVAGIRNTEDLDALKKHFPAIHDELLEIFARLERHYRDMCDTEFTIEQGKLWMLQTRVGKRTGAAALKMAVDMTKGTGQGAEPLEDQPQRGAAARHRPTTSTRCCTRSSPAPGKLIAKGLAASPGAAVGAVYFDADDAAAAAAEGDQGHPRAQRDEPRGRPRHDGVAGHPHRPRRPRQPRRRRRPRLGHARRRRRRVGEDQRQVVHGERRHRRTRATSSRSTAPPARWCSARWSSPPPSRRPSSPRSSAGPTPCARASSACAPTPTTARTPPTPAASAPRASGCAAPSTCSSPPTACRSFAA